MGKSAKLMRLASHEKQKRVLKGKEWRQSGHKQARIDAKKEAKTSSPASIFTGGLATESSAATGSRKNRTGALPFSSDLADRLRAGYDGQSNSKALNSKPATAEGKPNMKVKMGKIKLRQT